MSDPREAAERAATFKPGDRVRITDKHPDPIWWGRLGEVLSYHDTETYVRLDDWVEALLFPSPYLEPAPSTPAAVQGGKPPDRDIQVIERLDMFDVVEGSFLHMSFPFNPRSEASRDRTKARADGFKHGLLYEAALHAMGSSLADGPSVRAAPAPVPVPDKATHAENASVRPAPVPEVSDDMVKRALNEIIAQSGNIYFRSKHGMRAALTAALASVPAEREGGQ